MIGYLEEGLDLQVNLIYVSRDSVIGNYVFNFCDVYYPDMDVRRSWFLNGADSDFSSFNRNGYVAIHAFERTRHCSPFIHTPNDLLGLSVNNMDQAKRFTELNLGLVATLAGLVSNGVDDVAVDGLMVYPNPASGTLTVKGIPMKQIEVYNLFGQKVLNETCHGEETTLDVSSLAAGVYVLCVIDEAMRVHSLRLVTY